MEGYLIRVPVEACFQEARPTWRQRFDVNTPVRSRLLYYIIEEGYMRGYESPDAVDEPLETFELTSHRIEVNAMYSHNIFELKARITTPPPAQQFVEDTSTSSSDSSSDEDDNKQVKSVTTSTPEVTSGSYHVVFFAANKELVKKWSVKLLNWNRFVFGSSDDLDAEALKLAKDEITNALHAVNAANQFLRPIELRTPESTATSVEDVPKFSADEVSVVPPPVDLSIANSPLTPTEANTNTPPTQSAEVVKPSDSSAQPSNQWWVAPFGSGRSRRISSHSLRR